MEIYKDIPKRFLPTFERHEPVIQDHTATQEYRRCQREYFYSTVLQMKERETPVHLNFGSAYHKFREVLDLEYAKLSSAEKKDDKVLSNQCVGTALKSALALWDKEQVKDPPLGTKWDFMSRARLWDSCMYVAQEWKKEKHAGKIEVIATEQPLNVVIQTEHGIVVTGGRADQIVRVGGQIWGRDFKTTSKNLEYYDKRNDPNEQFTRYTYMESKVNGERVQGQIIEVLYNAPGGKTARSKVPTGPLLKTFTVSYTQSQLEEWERDQEYWNMALTYSRENDHYPKSYANCEWCKFRDVCKAPNERSIELILKTKFVFRPWDHTKVGDE